MNQFQCVERMKSLAHLKRMSISHCTPANDFVAHHEQENRSEITNMMIHFGESLHSA